MNPPRQLPPTPDDVPKLSATLVKFAEPLLAQVETAPGFEAAVTLAVSLWNIGALPPEKRGEGLWRLTESLRKNPNLHLPATAAADFGVLVQTRATVYGADRRIVADHRIVWTKGKPSLEVVAYDLSHAEGQSKAASPATTSGAGTA